MKIQVSFFSILADWVGVPEAEIDLTDGATYGDLLCVIGSCYRADMPDALWDDHRGGFARPVTALRNGTLLRDREAPLADGDHIRFMAAMGGG